MKLKLGRKVNKAYARIFAGIAFCIAGTLLVSSTILYFNFETIAQKQLYSSDLNSLQQASREVARMTETAKSLTTQIFIDPSFIPLLYSSNPDISEISAATRKLGFYRLSMPFINSIYIYNAKQNEMFIAAGNRQHGRQSFHELDDKGIIDMLMNFKQYKPYTPIPRTYEVGALKPVQISSYTYLGYNKLVNKLENAVVVNFSISWMNQLQGEEQGDSIHTTFIINDEGKLLSDIEGMPILSDLSGESYIQTILNHPQRPGYYVERVHGIQSLVSYTAPDELGWRYVRVTPTEWFAGEIRKMRTKVIIVSLSILTVGLLTAGIMSQRLYVPLARAIQRMKLMESERRRHLQIVRQDLLRNVILAREVLAPIKLQERLQEVGSKLDIQQSSLLIMLKIDDYTSFTEKYGDDAKLIKYAILNICTEIAAQAYPGEAIDMGDNNLLLLLNIGEALEGEPPLYDMLESMQAAIQKHLQLSVSLVISPVSETVNGMDALYKQVIEASFHRLFRGKACIIHAEEIMRLKSKEYEFPIHKEKQLIDCIMTGKTEEAKSLYKEIIDESSEYPFTVFQLALSHLTMSISNAINLIQRNNGLIIESDFDTAVISLHAAETIDEVNGLFYDLFDEIHRVMKEKRSSRHEDLIARINEWIEQEYSNYNLGLHFIADELGMSPVYISRLYKQFTLKSLTDVITEVRINKAKQLLISTDYSIAEIAERTGFTNTSYFYRIFKRENGVTPNDFRRSRLHCSHEAHHAE